MKKILLLLLLFPICVHAQYYKRANALFNEVTVFPNLTINNTLVNLNGASSMLPNADTIRANSIAGGGRYTFQIESTLNVPLVSIPNITVRIVVGNNTPVALVNGVGLIGSGTAVPFKIMGNIWFKNSTTAIVSAYIQQANGVVINTPIASMAPIQTYTIDPTQDLTFNITFQYGGVSLGTTSLNVLVFNRQIYQ